MADNPAKRAREARKRVHRAEKARRKLLRKQGLSGADPQGEQPPDQDVQATPEPTQEPPNP